MLWSEHTRVETYLKNDRITYLFQSAAARLLTNTKTVEHTKPGLKVLTLDFVLAPCVSNRLQSSEKDETG